MSARLSVVGLFAGIGGIEAGLAGAGHHTVMLNEIDASARRVLATHFPEIPLTDDVRKLKKLPPADIVAAGFPCTDISQAGRKTGIAGSQSSLVHEIFELVSSMKKRPNWLLLENVSYMLRLDRGKAMRYIVQSSEALGYKWAYRVVDCRAFGLPQRRQRVAFLASLDDDPKRVLFADDVIGADYNDSIGEVDRSSAYGFYWTEGLRGLGWTRNAVPTIKGGSSLGIPSPPAVWFPDTGEVGTPQIEDAERMQGFPEDWTLPSVIPGERRGSRWKQVGNAVCVPMGEWLGSRLTDPGDIVEGPWDVPLDGQRWPTAAWGGDSKAWIAPVSLNPRQDNFDIRKFLNYPLKPLSAKATAGFLERAHRSKLRFSDGFLESLTLHLAHMRSGS
jgi:DNA (cytosine-5)-methyltransferase 1